jgi:hypothetical protein
MKQTNKQTNKQSNKQPGAGRHEIRNSEGYSQRAHGYSRARQGYSRTERVVRDGVVGAVALERVHGVQEEAVLDRELFRAELPSPAPQSIPAQMWAGRAPVPAQMCAGRAPIPAQMWQRRAHLREFSARLGAADDKVERHLP